jgi:nucleoside-diphosphate-sugar epimerase
VLIQIGDLLRKRELVKLGARARAAGEPQRLIASVERLRREVKWKPERSFDRRLEETVQWWKAALSHPA